MTTPCSLAALQQLVKANSVVRYDISTGAVYASQAAAALPGLPKSVKYPAQRPRAQPPQPGTQPDEPSTSPSPSLPPGPSSADDDEDSDGDKDSSGELEQNPDILVDTTPSTTSAHNSPSPNPGPSDASPAPTEAPAQPGGSSSSSTAGSGGQGMGRRLRFVQPVDERKLVQTLPAFPLSPVGQLLSHGQEWHCTATLIAERTIITAAHCVFDRFSGSWARGLYFVPSRYRDGAGNIQAPVGSAYVSEIFIMGDYITGDPRDQWVGDMAIAVLPPNTVFGGAVGHLGYEAGGSKPEAAVTATATAASEDASSIAGWVQNPTAVAAAAAGASSSSTGRVILQRSRRLLSPSPSPSPSTEPPRSSWMQEVLDTAGYPSDLGEGALVHTSCLATSEPGSIGQSATYKLQKCSTAFGQSGSPLFDADGNIRGVVSFEIQGKNGFNGGCALTPYLWANLVAPYLA